jgi:aminoglycoside phosphotransferase family enzyme/predicted kinase
MNAAASRLPAPPPVLADTLRSPLCFAHRADRVEVVETHASWVFLAGEFAYKVKKPVRLDFLDFSTLERRRAFCEEELRLNARTAPGLYLGVVPITGSVGAPVVGGTGPAIEYAVQMRRFAPSDVFDERARAGTLEAGQVDALALAVARFHAEASRGLRRAGTPALDNFATIRRLEGALAPGGALDALEDWTRAEGLALEEAFAQRGAQGFVRECHGDLHLGNIVLDRGRPVPFDALEFDPGLRWIDVMGDVAFTVMDFHHFGLPAFAARFLNAYLEQTGDYAGLAVLRYYTVYRALVRAKVACIRAHQAGGLQGRSAAREAFAVHLRLAERLRVPAPASLTIMHGLSGSGKTFASQALLEAQGAVRIRSDIERKREPGFEYSPRGRDLVYARLEALARGLLAARYPVIVDATFLARSQRARFMQLARQAGAAFTIASCAAPEVVLRERLRLRARSGADVSDADARVLERQIDAQEPLECDELAFRRLIEPPTEA